MKICVKMTAYIKYCLKKGRQNWSFSIISDIHDRQTHEKSTKINIFACMNKYTATVIFSIIIAATGCILSLCFSVEQTSIQSQSIHSSRDIHPLRGGKKCRNSIFDEDNHAMNIALHLYTKFQKNLKKACGPEFRPAPSCYLETIKRSNTHIDNLSNAVNKSACKLIYILCRIQI